MGIVVEVTVPAAGFALPETLLAGPEETFRAVRLVAHGSGRAVPYLWVDCADTERIRQAMSDDPSVREFTVLAALDGRCLLRVEWGPRVRVFLSTLRAEGAFVLAASGYGGAWHLQVCFADHDSVPAARECCERRGMDVSFGAGTAESGPLGLTECQYETLRTAYELGYYDVPRGVTQEELADRLGVTHQALSERLRRAHGTLVENGLPRATHRQDPPVSARSATGVDI